MSEQPEEEGVVEIDPALAAKLNRIVQWLAGTAGKQFNALQCRYVLVAVHPDTGWSSYVSNEQDNALLAEFLGDASQLIASKQTLPAAFVPFASTLHEREPELPTPPPAPAVETVGDTVSRLERAALEGAMQRRGSR